MFLLANTQGFWLTGALSEHWCHKSHSHMECHAWTRLRGAPGANDLDPGLEGKDRQTGAYFLYFHLSEKERNWSILQGGQLWKLLVETRRNGSKILPCLLISEGCERVVAGTGGLRACGHVGDVRQSSGPHSTHKQHLSA